MDASLPSPPLLEPSLRATPVAAANALLRPAIRRFEEAMDPIVKAWAKQHWGERRDDGWELPRWAWNCRLRVGRDLRPFFDASRTWDAYTLGEIVQFHLAEFVQDTLQVSEDGRERYRDSIHHAGFMRNALAHSPEPSAAECVAGVDAVLTVLEAHDVVDSTLRAELEGLRQRLQRVASGASSLTVNAAELRMVIRESAMQHFAAVAGYEINTRYQPSDKAPPLPMAVAGRYGGRKSICAVLAKYHPELKGWPEYKAWIKLSPTSEARRAVEAITKARHALNHGKQDNAKAAVIADLAALLAIHSALALPTDRLRGLRDGLAPAADPGQALLSVELSAAEGPGQTVVFGTRIPMPSGSDPRNYLVGRDKLVAEVAARLRASAWSREVLYGESGAGKSVAAMRICDEVHGALSWQAIMHGSSVLALRSELARFARLRVSGLPDDAEEEQLVEAARSELASGWLLLVDDVGPDLDGVLALLPTHPDGSPAGHVLITACTQRSEWPEGVRPTLVAALSTKDSLELLRKGDPDKRVKAEIVSDASLGLGQFVEVELGNLPLDVALLKSALLLAQEHSKRKGIDAVAEAAATMARWRHEPMDSLDAAETRDPQRRSVRRRHGAVRELIRRLDECSSEMEVPAAARSLLALLSVLNADGVPSRLFASREGLGEGSDREGSALFGEGGLFAPAAAALEAVGLVRIEGGGALHMHQLVQRSARHVLTRAPTANALLSEWGTLVAVVARRFVSRAHEHSHREDVDALQPCAAALHGAGVLSPLGKANLADSLGAWHRDKGGKAHWEVGEALLREAVVTRRETLGDRHPDTLHSINNLGTLLQAKGDLDGAAPLYREALAASRETLGDRHPDTLASINNLGMLLADEGELDGAEVLHREALEGLREALGDSHQSTLASISNLGNLLQKKGDLDGAAPLLREAMEAMRETLGDGHPDTLTSISNLGNLLRQKGDRDGAEALKREALEGCRETLGERHPKTLASISDLGLLLKDKGALDGAEALYREALEGLREALGDSHQSTLASISNLGLLLQDKGDLDGAEALFREDLEARRETLGDRHPDTLGSIGNLGSLLHDKGDLDGAAPLLREAAAMRETLGDKHPKTLDSINSLGMLLQAKGDLDGAEALFREALAGRRETLGVTHPSTLISINNLGMLLQKKGDLGGAAPLLREALAARRETFGHQHPDTLLSINNLGTLLYEKGDLDGAAPLFREALAAKRDTLGDRHPLTLTSIANLGALLADRGDLAGAEELLREDLTAMRDTPGDKHPDTLKSIGNLGTLLQDKGDLDGAEELFRESFEGYRAKLGDGHPDTRLALQRMIACRARSKVSKRAIAASRPKQGPNEQCACGSGFKFKKCHGKVTRSGGRYGSGTAACRI